MAIVTLRSGNTKTGPMAQTWILARTMNPFGASVTGNDKAVCGDCKHRFSAMGTCYVNVARAPRIVWESYHRGVYARSTRRALRHVEGMKVRLGAYGDPAFVPFEVWVKALATTNHHTGYTHQWRTCDPRFKTLVMASVDSEAERAEAKAAGWRTFRVKQAGQRRLPGEMGCPASEEAGHKSLCFTCGKCNGGQGVDVVIDVHGMKKKRFLPVVAS